MPQLFVSIRTKSNWPTSDELAARNAIIERLESEGIGHCTGAGGGRGEMDFSFAVGNEGAAQAAIGSAMSERMPGVVYRIHAS